MAPRREAARIKGKERTVTAAVDVAAAILWAQAGSGAHPQQGSVLFMCLSPGSRKGIQPCKWRARWAWRMLSSACCPSRSAPRLLLILSNGRSRHCSRHLPAWLSLRQQRLTLPLLSPLPRLQGIGTQGAWLRRVQR